MKSFECDEVPALFNFQNWNGKSSLLDQLSVFLFAMVRTGIGPTILLLSVFGSPAMSPFGREFLSTTSYLLLPLLDLLSSRKLYSAPLKVERSSVTGTEAV